MRGQRSSPLGKAEHENKTRLPEVTDAELRARAAAAGRPVGEYMRDLINVHLYGVEHLVSVYREYLEGLSLNRAGIGPQPGPPARKSARAA